MLLSRLILKAMKKRLEKGKGEGLVEGKGKGLVESFSAGRKKITILYVWD